MLIGIISYALAQKLRANEKHTLSEILMPNTNLANTIITNVNGSVLIDHNLHNLDIFSDEDLAQAIENHPSDLLDICLKGSFIQVDRNEVSGLDIIECVKKGLLWINLRRIESFDNPIGNLIKQMHLESNQLLKRKTYNHVGGLLISSPLSGAGYHFDLTDVTLWHIRGEKKVYVYPATEPFLTKEGLEKVALGRGVEKIPYEEEFDKSANVFTLLPGQMMSWPHLTPHRVENGDCLNVSLSLESVTMASRLRLGSHFFDAFVRKRFGFQIMGHSKNIFVQFIKTLFSIVIKKTGISEQDKELTGYKYKLDMTSPEFLSLINEPNLSAAA